MSTLAHESRNEKSDNLDFPFIISTPVWGADHLGLFLDVSLPSLFAAGNLPSLTAHPQNRYLIYTRAEDEERLRAATAFRHLSSIIPVEVLLISDEIIQPHSTMSKCHADSMRRADEVGGAGVFLPPDCIWSDQSITALERIARTGKSVIYISGIRLDRDGVSSELAKRHSSDGGVLSLSSRELVSIGMRHLHPIALTHFWKDYGGGLMPANLVWEIPEAGWLLRCFHLHPLMVRSQIRFAKFSSTIDADLAPEACPDISSDYVVTDSDELLAFEMSGLSRVVGTICPKQSINGVATWAEQGANARHRELIKRSIRLKACDDVGAGWRSAQTESDEVVRSITEILAMRSMKLFFYSRSVFVGRVIAAALGRGVRRNDIVFAWMRALGQLLLKLLAMNAVLHRKIFFQRGIPRITHPLWLLRRELVAALQEIILESDRNVVLIGVDPSVAAQLRNGFPGSTIYGFAPGSKPDLTLLQRAERGEIDKLVTVDVELFDTGDPPQQQVGRLRILLRLDGDRKSLRGNIEDLRFFGGWGARLSSCLWSGFRRLGAKFRPVSPLAAILAKAVAIPLHPLFDVSLAAFACFVNVLGFLLDRGEGHHWTLFQRQGDSLPHRPST
jgi:hypothetical protein